MGKLEEEIKADGGNVKDINPVRHVVLDPSQPVPEDFVFLCEACGYCLIGLTSPRCPECGHEFSADEIKLARIPWLFRKRYGPVRAYVKTVIMGTFHPVRFAREMSRPVRISADDAKMFRRVVIRVTLGMALVTGVACLGGVIGFQIWKYGTASFPKREILKLSGLIPAGMVGLWLFLWLASDMPTFIWRGLPADPLDLAPLHRYAIAPLGFVPVLALLSMMAGLIMFKLYDIRLGLFTLQACSTVLLIVMALFLWLIPVIMMGSATRCSIWRQLLLAAYLPLHWAIIYLLSFLVGLAIMAPFTN
jgi:hypothetical protein